MADAVVARNFSSQEDEPNEIANRYTNLINAVDQFIGDNLIPRIQAQNPVFIHQAATNYATIMQFKAATQHDLGLLINTPHVPDRDVLECLIWRFLFRHILADSRVVLEQLYETRWELDRPEPDGPLNRLTDKEAYENGGRFIRQTDETMLGMALTSRDEAEQTSWFNARRLAVRKVLVAPSQAERYVLAGRSFKAEVFTRELARMLDAFYDANDNAVLRDFRARLQENIVDPAVTLREKILYAYQKYQLTLETFTDPDAEANLTLLEDCLANNTMSFRICERRQRLTLADYWRQNLAEGERPTNPQEETDLIEPLCAITPALLVGDWPHRQEDRPQRVLVPQTMIVRRRPGPDTPDARIYNPAATASGQLAAERNRYGAELDGAWDDHLPDTTFAQHPPPPVAYADRVLNPYVWNS